MSDFSTNIEHVLAFLGALVPLKSAVASYLNHKVRVAQANGEGVSTLKLRAASALNIGAMNLDKAMQMSNLAHTKKGKKR